MVASLRTWRAAWGLALGLLLIGPHLSWAAGEDDDGEEDELAALDSKDPLDEDSLEKLLASFDADVGTAKYTARDRRDPFRSLLERGLDDLEDRPEGVEGTSIDELELKGINLDPRRKQFYALMVANDGKTHRVYKGQKVWDGFVAQVRADGVVFEQTEIDPVTQEKRPPQRVEISLRRRE